MNTKFKYPGITGSIMKFISVDGGATKTISIIYDEDGEILSAGLASSSNFRNVGVKEASSNIMKSMNDAVKRSSTDWSEIAFCTFALAGVKDSDQSTSVINDFISRYSMIQKYELLNDGEAGYRCRFPGKDGIIVAPGTGMISYGRSGSLFDRCSGWGWFIGDEGGAFYLGRRAIQEAAKIADGRSDCDGLLLNSIMDKFNVNEPRKLVNEIYKDKIEIRKIASIAAILSENARRGDSASRSLIEEGAAEAAKCAIALLKKFKRNDIQVSGYGGVFRAGDLYWKPFTAKVLEEFPDTSFKKPLSGYHAVLGSMQIVLERHNLMLNEEDIEEKAIELDKIIEKLPSDELKSDLMM